nr:hypothetical protein [Neisseria subflava]
MQHALGRLESAFFPQTNRADRNAPDKNPAAAFAAKQESAQSAREPPQQGWNLQIKTAAAFAQTAVQTHCNHKSTECSNHFQPLQHFRLKFRKPPNAINTLRPPLIERLSPAQLVISMVKNLPIAKYKAACSHDRHNWSNHIPTAQAV